MTSLIFYNYKNGTTNGATLDCYTPAGERYFRFHLAVLTALTPNCPDVYYEYPNNPKTFVDYLAENHLLPSLDADAIKTLWGFGYKFEVDLPNKKNVRNEEIR